MGSRRLSGKTLMALAGRPAIDWLLERLEHSAELDDFVVATSDSDEDDPIAAHCETLGVACHRGSLEDVAMRVLGAAEEAGFDVVARVNGDSPLLDQRLIDRGVELIRATAADVITNVRPRTFPPGQSVEVIAVDALRRVVDAPRSAEDREHVTGPLYGGGFRVQRFQNDPPRTEPPLTLDTAEDHARLEAILGSMTRPHWTYTWEDFAS
jgi:spore coat polysaccharide biosynthesis protein SpsF (cytidylyltransferase family)